MAIASPTTAVERVILAVGLVTTTALAQAMIYPTGPNGGLIVTPGNLPTPAYMIRGPDGRTTYFVPAQQPRQDWQQHQSGQDSQQYRPGNR
jgi:hypothetical protein